MVLDESWHMEAYVCRDRETIMPGVSHLRLSAPGGLFQLQGCEGRNDLKWIQYPSYGEPNHPTEWCRPVAFPGNMVMYDHSPQGGPMDIETLTDPEKMKYYIVDGVELARDNSGPRDVIFTRPTGPVAFANLMAEPVRLTRGEGVWIPIAMGVDGKWRTLEWGEAYKQQVEKIINNDAEATEICRGCQWHINNAMTLLEQAYLFDEESDEDTRAKAVQAAIEELEKAKKAKPWDWYTKVLLHDLRVASPAEVPALIHADRFIWLAGMGNMDQLQKEYEAAMVAKPNYHLAMYTRLMAQQLLGGDNGAYVEGLKALLRFHPKHAQALFDLGIAAYNVGYEKRELKYYAKAIKADPTFAPPYYNTGKTYQGCPV